MLMSDGGGGGEEGRRNSLRRGGFFLKNISCGPQSMTPENQCYSPKGVVVFVTSIQDHRRRRSVRSNCGIRRFNLYHLSTD